MKIILVLLLALFFVACSSSSPTSYLGRSGNDFMTKFGAPVSVSALPAKSSIYVYKDGILVVVDSANKIIEVFEIKK